MEHLGISAINDLLESARKLADAPDPERHLPRECLKAAAKALQVCRADPDIILAFLRLPSPSANVSDALSRHIYMMIVVGIEQRINDHTLQHLVAATILSDVVGDAHHTAAQRSVRRLISLFRTRGFTLWVDILILRKAFTPKKARLLLRRVTLNRYQRLVLITRSLAQALHFEPFQAHLRRLAAAIPSQYHSDLHPLLKIPGEFGPGVRVMNRSTSAHILAIRGGHAAVVNASEKSSEAVEHEWVSLQTLMPSLRKPVSFDTWLKYYEQCQPNKDAGSNASPFRREYPINRPPASLLQIIDALQAADIEIDRLCDLISKEPVFTDFLRQSASSDNRLQLPVHNVKQAVLTYGTERVGDMLTQQALQTRLNQYNYPLGSAIRHFTVLVSAIASQLAVYTETRFTSQSAALVATFLTAPLFMLPGMKTLTVLPVAHGQYHDIEKLMKVKGTENWQTLVSDLAQGWHQPATWRALLYHTGKHPADVPRSLQKEFSLLCLSIYWASSWLFAGADVSAIPPVQAQQAAGILGLPFDCAELIRHEIASLLYCPVDL